MKRFLQSRYFELQALSACAILSGCLSLFLGQDRNWDLRNYHFYNGFAVLNSRMSQDIAPAQLQTYLNPFLDVPVYLMITHLPPVLYAFLIGALHGLNLYLLFKISYCIFKELSPGRRVVVSAGAAVAGYAGAANMAEIGTTFHDNTTSILVLWAVLLVVATLQNSVRQGGRILLRRIAYAGVLLGVAAGFKYTNGIYALAFIMSIGFLGASLKMRTYSVLVSVAGVGCGFVSTAGPWMVILYKAFASPLFPFYNAIFQSPFYPIYNFIDNRWFPDGLYQTLLYPFYFLKYPNLVCEGSFRDPRIALCYMLFLLFLFIIVYEWARSRYDPNGVSCSYSIVERTGAAARYFIPFFVFSYICWQYSFSVYRYLIALELLCPVFLVLIVRYLFPFERLYWALSIVMFVLLVICVSPIRTGRISWSDSFFDVKIENASAVAGSTVLIAGDEPVSYLIPYFPKSATFVSVNNNFFHPDSKTALQGQVKRALDCSDRLYLLYKEGRTDYAATLSAYGLALDSDNYTSVYTKMDKGLRLWRLIRQK